ncbi:MAG TPA: hypothetical protein VNL98_07190, partial [Gemmatimonadales bacterium]|nr:hypothetical protein [Gemmatimonadales bacterium]
RRVNPVHSLRIARAGLIAAVALTALVRGLAAGCIVLAAAAAADATLGLAEVLRRSAYPVAVFLAAAVATSRLWKGRIARDLGQVALFVEGLRPELGFGMVALIERKRDGGDGDDLEIVRALERDVAGVPWQRAVVRRVLGVVARDGLLLVGAVLVLRAAPARSLERLGAAGRSDRDAAAPAALRGTLLAPLRARITPPAYTQIAPFTVQEPSAITAISGSTVVLEGGAGAPARGSVTARLDNDTIPVTLRGGRWTVRLVLTENPAALRLSDGTAERLVTLEPYPDSLPDVRLESPARDTVLRSAEHRLPLAARARDDFGMSAAWFEYIISSGEGESFRFRTGTVARESLALARSAALEGSLDLGALRLGPGDLLHLRAVATDARTVRGPGRGVSETRTFRIARSGEYDSIAFEGLPPVEGDTSALSQRLLIILAEALERRRPRLARDTVVTASRDIARDQARLRRRVSDIIFQRLGEAEGEHAHEEGGVEAGAEPGDRSPEAVLRAAEAAASVDPSQPLDFAHEETPVVAVNRPLLEAYNAMWEAGRWLEIGEPDDALPHMRAALAAIQRARQAERLYLRGRTPALVVDLRAVRLAGNRSGVRGGTRTSGGAAADSRELVARRLAAHLDLALGAGAAALADSLQVLRLDALGRLPRVAAALAEAVDALRAGRDATGALVRARRALAGPARRDGSREWEGW